MSFQTVDTINQKTTAELNRPVAPVNNEVKLTPEERRAAQEQIILDKIGLKKLDDKKYESTVTTPETVALAQKFGIKLPEDPYAAGNAETWKVKLLEALLGDPAATNKSETAPSTDDRNSMRAKQLESRAAFLAKVQKGQRDVLYKALGMESDGNGGLTSNFTTLEMSTLATRFGLPLPEGWDASEESAQKWKKALVDRLLEPQVVGYSQSGRAIMTRPPNFFQVLSALGTLENGAEHVAAFKAVSKDPERGGFLSAASAEAQWRSAQRRLGFFQNAKGEEQAAA